MCRMLGAPVLVLAIPVGLVWAAGGHAGRTSTWKGEEVNGQRLVVTHSASARLRARQREWAGGWRRVQGTGVGKRGPSKSQDCPAQSPCPASKVPLVGCSRILIVQWFFLVAWPLVADRGVLVGKQWEGGSPGPSSLLWSPCIASRAGLTFARLEVASWGLLRLYEVAQAGVRELRPLVCCLAV